MVFWIYYHLDKSTYEGSVRNGLRHGKGVYTFNSGIKIGNGKDIFRS